MSGGMFTWSNNQVPPTLEKLDRILVSKDWEDSFPHAMLKKLPREVSDHNPLIIVSGTPKGLPHIQFKFDLNWFSNPDFFPLLEKIWNRPCRVKTAFDRIQQKLKLFKQFFKGWGFNQQGVFRKLRKYLQIELPALEELEETSTLSGDQVVRKQWVLCENLKLLEQEEVY